MSRQISTGRRQRNIIFLSQHFGTGVLIATAFVHLLPTAFSSLTDPCLPFFFSQGYKPLAGLIAMAFALSVVAIESYLTTRGAGHSHSHQIWDDDDESEDGIAGKVRASHDHGFASRRNRRPTDIALEDIETDGLVAGVSPLPGSTPTIHPVRRPSTGPANGTAGPGDDDDDDESLNFDLDEMGSAEESHGHSRPLTKPVQQQSSADMPANHMPNAEEQKRMLLQCLLLEAGILFHSVFIGMALSVATGPAFVVFLIAISFHQTFEGLALGSRIAAIHFPKSSLRPWLMVLAYGTTTPIGQAIGLFVHNLYDPMSQTGLLMVGFMNAISSGLLLFAGLVQLLAEDFLTEKSYKTLHGRKRVHAFSAVVAGASLMALVGAFA
jgi:hypothetical protein